MAEETTTPEKGGDSKAAEQKPNEKAPETKPEDKPAAEQTDADIEEIAAKADKPDAVKKALTEERSKAKTAQDERDELAKKVKEYEDRDKSEQEKLEEKASTAEERATKAEAALTRFKVAYKKKLPFELAERLTGEDEKALEEDADRLLELVKPDGKPTGDADAGKGEGGGGTSFNDAIRAA